MLIGLYASFALLVAQSIDSPKRPPDAWEGAASSATRPRNEAENAWLLSWVDEESAARRAASVAEARRLTSKALTQRAASSALIASAAEGASQQAVEVKDNETAADAAVPHEEENSFRQSAASLQEEGGGDRLWNRLLRREVDGGGPRTRDGASLRREDYEKSIDVPSGRFAAQMFILSAAGKDCPPNSFPIQDAQTCTMAMEDINSFGQEILLLPAIGNPNVSVSMDDHASGCFLHCPKQTECTVYYNEAAGKLGKHEDRRYCKDYFLHSKGDCQNKDGQRKLISRGTFKSVHECKMECLRGPLHQDWCDSFEVGDPFSNECFFFKDGYGGNNQFGSRCYSRTASGH